MSSPPIPLWQVLRDEYESFHGQPPEVYAADIGVLARAVRSPEDGLSNYVAGRLTSQASKSLSEWDGQAPLPDRLKNSLTDAFYSLVSDEALAEAADDPALFRAALEGAGVRRAPAELPQAPLQPDEVYGVNARLLEAAYPGLTGRIDWATADATDEDRLRWMYTVIRQRRHAALCLSGGGIRSATFNLGILQGLARHGLLGQFHYLSTVSGGGFVGGWLSAWVRRAGIDAVVHGLSDPPRSPIDPDPHPLAHLRAYGNYLSPKVGLLSADTWTMVATLLRNVFLNWLVFVPVIAAALMLPRFWMRFVLRGTEYGVSGTVSLWVGAFSTALALACIGLSLPSARPLRVPAGVGRFLDWLSKPKRLALLCLLPLVVSALAFTIYWIRLHRLDPAANANFDWWTFVWFFLRIVLIPWLLVAVFRIVFAADRVRALVEAVGATALVTIAQVVSNSLVWYVATHTPMFSTGLGDTSSHVPYLYACFAVPVFLFFQILAATLLAGFTSRFTEYDDQEWWARLGAWSLILILGWVVVFTLVIYGPLMLLALDEPIRQHGLRVWEWEWGQVGKWAGTLGGIVAGAVSLFGGFSAKTPANAQEARKAGPAAFALHSLTSLLAPLFLAFLFILISLVTTVVLGLKDVRAIFRGFISLLPGWLLGTRGAQFILDNARDLPDAPLPSLYWPIVGETSIWLILAVCLVVLGAGVFTGLLVNTNRFSLHYFWRNRIVRAYMGASSPERRPNVFTGFDPNDNLQMHDLRQPAGRTRLLHVLNLALNLVGGSRLSWQERNAESFTVSPLHCGSFWPELGYRRSEEYGGQPKNGRRGISLGTAVAISGAFASPNMGYMMTSPVLRFLMTLFNIRFGWWLGNPGPAGDRPNWLGTGKTYDRDSPRYSVIPIFKESLGMTGDRSAYVYLSDGGHFENFGLYEMILRRSRFVVVGDASTDPEYAFSSLGQSIRQIRVDLGVPIEFDDFLIAGPGLQESGKYCAVGRIRYSCVDGGDPSETDGTLVYIKPSLLGAEPRDVLNYAGEHAAFPQEFIGDQWFTESQFESYRALSSHMVEELCGQMRGAQTFESFEWSVREHLRSMGLGALDPQINDLLMREEIKSHLLGVAPPERPPQLSYLQEKIRKHVGRRFD
jgi:Patatin-like phospholipase